MKSHLVEMPLQIPYYNYYYYYYYHYYHEIAVSEGAIDTVKFFLAALYIGFQFCCPLFLGTFWICQIMVFEFIQIFNVFQCIITIIIIY